MAGAAASGITAEQVKQADAAAAKVSPVPVASSSQSVALNEVCQSSPYCVEDIAETRIDRQITKTDMPDLKLLARGKVRDLYELPDAADADKLLFVATDRISAFDVIMENVSTAVQGVSLPTGYPSKRHHPLDSLAFLVPQAVPPDPQSHRYPDHRPILFLPQRHS